MSNFKARWAHYKSYSGVVIMSSEQIPVPTGEQALLHVDRAFWLTTKVETRGTFGTVMNYDGTGMTAGPDQHIAVYPSELVNEDYNAEDDQGSLWQLLSMMRTVIGTTSYQQALEALLLKLGLANLELGDGKLVYKLSATVPLKGKTVSVTAGDTAHGAYIRNILSPIDGLVPQAGPQWDIAANWAELFHLLFVHPDGYQAQLQFGKNHLIERSRTWKVDSRSIEAAIYPQPLDGLKCDNAAFDLAMCVYQSHSVNAPGAALKILKKVLTSQDLPKDLLRALGTSTYGEWSSTLPSGRYQRTRDIAKASGLWPHDLFESPYAVMPKSL